MEHLVEGSGNVEAECVRRIVEHLSALNVFPGAPFLIGERIFHLVAVAPCLPATQSRGHFRNRDLSDTRQCVDHGLALAFKLSLIRDVLPFASTADSEVAALRLHPHLRGGYEPLDMSFCKRVLLSVYLP